MVSHHSLTQTVLKHSNRSSWHGNQSDCELGFMNVHRRPVDISLYSCTSEIITSAICTISCLGSRNMDKADVAIIKEISADFIVVIYRFTANKIEVCRSQSWVHTRYWELQSQNWKENSQCWMNAARTRVRKRGIELNSMEAEQIIDERLVAELGRTESKRDNDEENNDGGWKLFF